MKTSSVGVSLLKDDGLVNGVQCGTLYSETLTRRRDVASYISTEAIKSEFVDSSIRQSAHSTGCCASIDASRGKPGRSGWFTKIYFPALSDSR